MKDIANLFFLKKFSDVMEISEYDSDSGKPGLLEAFLDDRRVIIKFWPTDKNINNSIIEDIWRYEIRQLHRLKGLPGLGDFISLMIDSGRDSKGFYLVLDAGFRKPLSYIFKEKKKLSLNREWVKNTKLISNRIRLWENLIRIVSAIGLLHSQGLLHRHLDKDSILTDPHESDYDFQLTGFEWSLRVHAISSLKRDYITNSIKSTKQYSFLSDWADLGYLTSELLKINVSLFLDQTLSPVDLVNNTELTLNEVTLIRGLIGVMKLESNIPREAINGELIIDKIKTIINSLKFIESKTSHERLIAFHFSPGNNVEVLPDRKTSVFKAIQHYVIKRHGITLCENDIDRCLDYIRKDIAVNPFLTIHKLKNNTEEILLIGESITYILDKKRNSKDDDEDGWDVAFCHSAYIEPPNQIKIKSKKHFLKNETLNCFHMRKEYKNVQSKSWEDSIVELRVRESDNISNRDIIDGFSIFHLAEIAFAKSEIYPVSIISHESERSDSKNYIVKLKCRQDSGNISSLLGLKQPALRLQETLDKERINSINWILTDNQRFTDEDQNISIDYIDSNRNSEGEIEYIFTTNSTEPEFKNCFILPASTQGTIRQLSRRASAIDELSNHAELRGMLSNPYMGTIISDLPKTIHNSYDSLDESKKDAFRSINKTLPMYLVQGPPGVGKTFLVTTLVNQIFLEEKESRVALTAQSHSTVQHLYQEVISSLKQNNFNPLIVSCIKKERDDNEDSSHSQLDLIALSYIHKFSESSLFLESNSIAAKNAIINAAKITSRSDRYSLIKQILKSANIVFATSNSRQVEDLIKEKSQFDWSIMEETGKVTGIELLSPMLLSYRRLMIGDHKQLPPYASEKMRGILSNPKLIKNIILISLDVNNYSMKGEWIKERFTENYIANIDDNELEKLSLSSLRLHQLFESLINEEESQLSRSKKYYGDESKHRGIASMLHFQHRMHPDISDLISFVFYNGKLKTSPEKENYYRSENSNLPFRFKKNSPLEVSPAIVWVDIPDVQKTKSNVVSDTLPAWINRVEKNTVISILQQLRIDSESSNKPKLAIMSPYAKQVELIAKEIEGKIRNGDSLNELNGFLKPDDHSSFCSTVDGFQGAEADIVIVSMVRNNSHSYIRASLGFLLDSRRMNVLFSRAKYKLIIVGSFSFLEYWSKRLSATEVKNGIEDNVFLIKLIQKLKDYEKSGLMKVINYKDFKKKK